MQAELHNNAAPASGEDPTGLLAELDAALRSPELVAQEDRELSGQRAMRAARRLAVVIGRIRIYGVEVGDDGVVLPPNCAVGALHAMREKAEILADRAASLGARWDTAEDVFLADDAVASLLYSAFELWAAQAAGDDTVGVVISLGESQKPALAALKNALADYYAAKEKLDAALRANAALLTVACETHLLDNLRASLTDELRQQMPWWLDGTLETLGQRQRETLTAVMPDEQSWATVRQLMKERAEQGASAEAEGRSRPQDRRHDMIFRFPRAPMAMAASTGSFAAGEAEELIWDGPEGATASMEPNATIPDDALVYLLFDAADGSEMLQLQGISVVLAGVGSVVDQRGRAGFNAGALRAAAASGASATLTVGGEGWTYNTGSLRQG